MSKNINLKEYQKFVKTIAKKFENRNEEIMTWGLGISGEAGDVASCIKKTFAHENDQTEGIRENIGDTFWYMAAICNFFGWDIEEIIGENMAKLKKDIPRASRLKKRKEKWLIGGRGRSLHQ